MREVAGALEGHEAAAGHRRVRHTGVFVGDHRVALAPDQQRGHAAREIAAIEHRHDLAAEVHHRAQRPHEREARAGVG